MRIALVVFCSVSIVAILAIGLLRAGGQEQTGPAQEDQRRKEVLAQIKRVREASEDPFPFVGALKKLFALANTEELRELKADASESLALDAAWQLVLQSVSAKDAEEGKRINPLEIERFLGLVEGRLRVRLPRVWENAFASVRSAGPGRISLSRPVGEALALLTDIGWVGFQTELIRTKSGYMLKSATRTVDLGPDILSPELDKQSLPRTFAQYDHSLWYVVVFRNQPNNSSNLYCLEESGKLVWKANVYAEGAIDTGGLSLSPIISLTVTDSAVLAFGATSEAYIEGFGKKDGKNLFRFSTYRNRSYP